jgi:hypothetical protein
MLREDVGPAPAADACWALTSLAMFTQLTVARAWPLPTYRRWLTNALAATLLAS